MQREVFRICFYFANGYLITDIKHYKDEQEAINYTTGRMYSLKELHGEIDRVEIINLIDYLNFEHEKLNDDYYIERDLGLKKIVIRKREK